MTAYNNFHSKVASHVDTSKTAPIYEKSQNVSKENKLVLNKDYISSSEESTASEDVPGKNEEFEIYNWKQFLNKTKMSYTQRTSLSKPQTLKKSDLKFIRTLGKGGFSRVMLTKLIPTSTYYAAKIVSKKLLVQENHIEHALNEKMVLQGGEMFQYLCSVNRLNESTARFYSAQILLALEYLHNLGLAYRDLKPENILLDDIGYLKLADFGFCKKVEGRTFTFCGTHEYIAPEMFGNQGYGTCIDWWAFGVFVYELCAGYTPFYAKSIPKIYDKIVTGIYKCPPHYSVELKDLLKNMLQIDLTKRYGNLRGGIADIKEHKWFSNVPWLVLVNRQIKAPYVPSVGKIEDASHFMKLKEDPLEESKTDPYQKEFANF